jgi:hypothetical protein
MFEEKQKHNTTDCTQKKYSAIHTPGSLNPYSPGLMPFNTGRKQSASKVAPKGV